MDAPPALTYFPMSSFPNLIETGQLSSLKAGCFVFDLEVKPGWIHYNPNEVTVLSCNEMFRPLFPVSSVCQIQEQTLSINTQREFETLQEMFSRPIVLCATRRQEEEATANGFDTDFVIVIDPADSRIAQELIRITELVREKLRRRKKFYLTIDLMDKLDELSPLEYRKHILWLRCGFYITNFSAPCAILYRDAFCIWYFVVPCCLLVAAPYRVYRKLRCTDRRVDLNCRLVLKMSYAVPLILHCFSTDRPFPGRYLQDADKYNACLRRASEIHSLIDVPESQR